MKKTNTIAGTTNSARKLRERLGRAAFVSVALSLTIWMAGSAGPARADEISSLSPLAPAAPACGEELSLLSQSGAQSLDFGAAAEPGTTDPMGIPAGRYVLFPDDEVLAFQPSNARVEARVLATDNGGTTLNPADYAVDAWNSNGFGPPQYFPAAGRFIKPTSDDALWAARNGNPNDPTGAADITFLGGTEHGFVRTFSAILPGGLLPRQPAFSDFLGVASGDLDNVVGSDGNLHDQAVVASVGGQDSQHYRYNIDVLNYGSGKIQEPEISSAYFVDYKPSFQTDPAKSISGLLPSDNVLAVVTGDFQGTGKKEVAVIALGDNTLLLYTYRYDTVGTSHKLTSVGAQYWVMSNVGNGSPWQGKPVVGTIAATTGDFDGDGADELAVAYSKWGESPDNKSYGGYGVGMLIFKYNSSFQATLKNDKVLFSVGGLKDKAFAVNTRPVVDIAAGQFLLDPTTGISLGRKQIVLGWKDTGNAVGSNSNNANVQLRAYSISRDLSTASAMGGIEKISVIWPVQKFSIAAGGFEGASGKLPVSQLAVSYWFGNDNVNAGSYAALNTYRVNANGILGWQGSTSNTKLTGVSFDSRMRVPVIAYDGFGRSRYLGNPVHLTAYTSPTTDYVMQEPPKHAYWDERKHAVTNITRYDSNYVHLFQSNTASFSTQTKSESSRNTGGWTAVSAGGTVKTGIDFGIVKSGAEVATDITTKGSYDYSEHKESYDSQYRERTVASSGQTDRDDYLKGQMQSIEIWRYRVYGSPNGNSSMNGFYELVFPGITVPFAGGGLNYSWYQPIHENGNILSYPQQLGPNPANRFIPIDIGSFTLPNDKNKSYTEPLVPPTEQRFDGTSGTVSLQFNDEISNSGSFTYSHTIGENFDTRVTVTGNASVRGNGFESRFCGSFEFHNSNSWGGNNTSTSTTKDQTSVVLNRGKGDVSTAYPFDPVVYNTKDGTLKMAFGVPNPASSFSNPSGYNTYARIYGGLPDPALNLPLRFLPKSSGSGELEAWVPNEEISRKKMRGLFFRHSEIDPAANTYLQWAFNPKPGDMVRIEPRVYNYSTAETAVNTVVEFQVIGYDSARDSEVCESPINAADGKKTGLICPRSARTTIGRSTVPKLNPLQFTCVSGYDAPASTGCAPSVFLNWDTGRFGPDFGTYDYRVYVVLNPDNPSGQEIYGLEPNSVDITNVANATPMVVTAPGSDLETGEYVVIGGVQGLDKANGIYTVTRISSDQFALNGTVASRGSYTGGGLVSVLDPGQNNEGYGSISITRVPAVTAGDATPHDYLNRNSLEALGDNGTSDLIDSGVTALEGVPLELRFTTYSTIIHAESAHMLLFDGDPAEGNPAIADQIIHPGAHGPDGTSIWFTWTPATPGLHHLYAALVEGPQQNEAAAALDVNVIPAQGASQ